MFRLFVQPARLTRVAIPVALFVALLCLPSDASSAGRRGGGNGGGGHGGNVRNGVRAGQLNMNRQNGVNPRMLMQQQQNLNAQLAQLQFLQARARTGKNHTVIHNGKGNRSVINTKTLVTPTGNATLTTEKSKSKVAGLRHHGKKPGTLVTTQKTLTVNNGLFGPSATTVNTVSKIKGKRGGKSTVKQTTVSNPFGLDTVTAFKVGKGKLGKKGGKFAINQLVFPVVDPLVALDAFGNPVVVGDQVVLAPVGVAANEVNAVVKLKRPRGKKG
jgi:hypothetical protein